MTGTCCDCFFLNPLLNRLVAYEAKPGPSTHVLPIYRGIGNRLASWFLITSLNKKNVPPQAAIMSKFLYKLVWSTTGQSFTELSL